MVTQSGATTHRKVEENSNISCSAVTPHTSFHIILPLFSTSWLSHVTLPSLLSGGKVKKKEKIYKNNLGESSPFISLCLWLNLFYKLLFATFYMYFQMGKAFITDWQFDHFGWALRWSISNEEEVSVSVSSFVVLHAEYQHDIRSAATPVNWTTRGKTEREREARRSICQNLLPKLYFLSNYLLLAPTLQKKKPTKQKHFDVLSHSSDQTSLFSPASILFTPTVGFIRLIS